MYALLTLLFANISKFLNYLNINPRLQNKIFTIMSIFPTLYMLRIVKGYFNNQNYVRFFIFLVIFIVLVYFIILNFIYYFKDRKVKWDVTNFIEDIVPEDLTYNADGTVAIPTGTPVIHGKALPLRFFEDSDFVLEEIINQLIASGELTTNSLDENQYLLDKYALIPYYRIKKDKLMIGSSYADLKEIAEIKLDENEVHTLIPLGVFILGGPYQLDGITYKQPYTIELRVKAEDEPVTETRSQRFKA